MKKPKKGTVDINLTAGGRQTYDAWIVGGWAVHLTPPGFSRRAWTVTQRDTGLALVNNVWSKAEALRIAREADAIAFDFTRVPQDEAERRKFMRRRRHVAALKALRRLRDSAEL